MSGSGERSRRGSRFSLLKEEVDDGCRTEKLFPIKYKDEDYLQQLEMHPGLITQ